MRRPGAWPGLSLDLYFHYMGLDKAVMPTILKIEVVVMQAVT
jgi:hypothetical protein